MFYNGDIVMFNDLKPMKKKCFFHRFFKKIYEKLFGCDEYHHCVHTIFDSDFNLKIYDLKNGDIYKVDSCYFHVMSLTPLNLNIEKCMYYTTSVRNFRIVPNSEYTKILRKEKLNNLKVCSI